MKKLNFSICCCLKPLIDLGYIYNIFEEIVTEYAMDGKPVVLPYCTCKKCKIISPFILELERKGYIKVIQNEYGHLFVIPIGVDLKSIVDNEVTVCICK